MIKKIITLSIIATATAFTSSCATVAGVGQDVQKLGNSMQNTAIRSSQQ